MEKRLAGRWRLFTFGFILLVAAVLFAWTGAYKVVQEKQEFELRDAPDLRSMMRSNRPEDQQRARRLQADYDVIFAAVLARNPGLEPKWKSVPDEKNGFLQWLEFCEKRRGVDGILAGWDMPKNVRNILDGAEAWNPDVMAAFLLKHQNLLDEITRIGMLPDQSTHGISPDRWSFIEANLAKGSADLLCARARLAAESGDQQLALRNMKAAIGLAQHHGGVETPTLIAATVSVLIQLTVLGETMHHVFPAINLGKAEYAQWRKAILPEQIAPFSNLVRGEFWGGTRGLVIPIVSNNLGSSEKEIPDPEALYDAIAQGYLYGIKEVEAATYTDLWKKKGARTLFPEVPPTLSEQSKEVYAMLHIGWKVYGNGWARSAAIIRRCNAAFCILEGRTPPLELLTGKPFKFDPVTRILSFPKDPLIEAIGSEELKLP